MDLFEIVNGHVYPSPHALMIDPFDKIWEGDTSKGKAQAIKELTYIELMCSPKKSNPFAGYPIDERKLKVKKEIFADENYLSTTYMILGCNRYIELLKTSSPTYPLFEAAINAAGNLTIFLNSDDILTERTQGGASVYKPADITKALKEIPEVIKSITSMRDKIQSELVENSKTRNSREIGQYER